MVTGVDRPTAGSLLAGIGLAAAFDGILLHRILQWHHLLGHGRPSRGALRWDGAFDAASLALLLAGLAMILHDRARLSAATGRYLTGAILSGFGLWHLTEGIVVHLILRIHRVRPLAEMPLVWDLGWLVAFGVIPLSVGLVLHGTPER